MGRALLRVVAIAIAAVVAGGVGVATAAPTVTIEKHFEGVTTNNPEPSFGGVAEEVAGGVTLTIYIGTSAEGTPVQTLMTLLQPLGGTWELSTAHLADGTYTAQASQTDLALETGVSEPVTFVVHAESPTVTLNGPPSPSKDATPSFTGSASESATPVVVHIYNSSEAEVASATAAGTGGAWTSADASPPLANGEYEAIATQASSFGDPEGKSKPANFTVDTTPPSVSLTPITSPTNNTEPTFSGAAGDALGDSPTVILKIYSGETASGTPIHEVPATVVGTTWTVVATESLTEGTYTAQAEQSDDAGNVGRSLTSIFTIKTKGPAVSLSSVASLTNDPTPGFSGGAGVAPGDIASVTLNIYAGESASGSPIRTMAVEPSGATWNANLPVTEPLPEGTYTVQAEQSDKAGNTTKSAAPIFTVDTTPPALSLTAITSPTNNPKPSFGGSAGVAPRDIKLVTLKIYSGEGVSGGLVQTVHVTPSGATWSTSLTQALNEGTYTAQAEQSDEAGNTTKSAASIFTVDTVAPAVSLTPVAALTNNPKPSFSGGAGVAPGDIAAVTLNIYVGESVSGLPLRTFTVTPTGSTWSESITESLPDGTYTVQAEQSDAAGNVGKSGHPVFTVDTTPPAVSLSLVSTPTNNPEPSFSGGAGTASGDNASVTLKVYSGGNTSGTLLHTLAATVSGSTWKATLTAAEALPEGTYTVQAEQSDKAGNIGKSVTSIFAVDTTPPAVSLTLLTSPTNNPKPSFGGNAGIAAGDIPLVTLKIYSGAGTSGAPIQTLKVTPAGAAWSTSLTQALNDGTYTAQAEQSDEAGNTTKSTPSIFTVDTVAPAVSLAPVAALTNNPKPSFSGGAGVAAGDIASVTLKIYSGESTSGMPLRSVPITPTGSTWSESITESLPDGTYTVQAEQSDAAGNVGKSGHPVFTVDTTPPAVSLSLVSTPTNNTEPSFTGNAGTAFGDNASVMLKIYSGASASGTPIHTLAATVSGSTWKATLTVAEALPEGTYTVQAEQSDKAGNIGKSTSSTFAVYTTPPPLSLTPVTSPTNDSTPSFSGAAGDAPIDIPIVTLKIYAGASASGTPIKTVEVTPSGAAWKTTLTEVLPDHTYTAQAEQSDKAGNTTKSAPSTFTVDTTPPTVSLSPVSAVTDNPKPSFTGGAGIAPGDIPSVRLNIYVGITASGTPLRSFSVTPAGSTWSTSLAEALPEGTYTVQAEQSDEAKNTGKSATSTFTVDITPPAVSLSPVSTPTNNPEPSFSGNAGTATGDIASVSLKIYSGASASGTPIHTLAATVSGTTWKATPTVAEALSEGTYTVQAEQTDTAGNIGKSATSTFAVYTTPPPLSLVPVTSPTNDPKPSFSGAAGDASVDVPIVTLKVYSGAGASGTPIETLEVVPTGATWSTSMPQTLNDGTYTAQAEQSDKAGNTARSAPSTFTVDTTPPAVSLASVPALTDNPKPSFSGGAGVAPGDVPSVKLNIYVGSTASGTPLRSVPVTPTGGTWSTSLAEGLSEGTYTVQAEQADEAKNTGKSATSTFTVDLTPPAVTLNPMTPFTADATPAFSGSAGTASGDIASVTLNIYSGEGVSGTLIKSVPVVPTGAAWSASTPTELAEGTYTVQAEQSDKAGNIGKSTPSIFTVKIKGPGLSLSPVGAVTNNSKPSFSGVAGVAPGDIASVTLNIYTGTTASGIAYRTVKVTPSAGAWQGSVPEALPDGTYNAQAEQSDEAGNTTKSARSIFIVDTKPPAVTITTPANGATLNKSRPTFTGAAGIVATPGDEDLPTVTLKIFAGTSTSGTPQTVLIMRNGATWTTGSSGPKLPDGTYTALVEQSDAAGNIGTSQTEFKIKTNSPVVTLDSSAFVARGSGPSAALFTGATPTFTGSASAGSEDSKTVTLRIYAGASASGTPVQTVEATLSGATWTAGPVAALSEGAYTVQAEQTDASVNAEPGVSAPVPFSVDATPPHVTLTYPANGSSTSGESELVGGVAGSAEGDLPTVTVQLFSGSTISEGQSPIQSIAVDGSAGTWSATFAGLAAGTYTARAEQSDDTGNVGVSAPTTFVITGSASPATSAQGPTTPVASFTWFPTSPHPREPVSLASSSTDPGSPITAFAWDLAGDGVLTPGSQVMKTTFATAGNHVVKLRVTGANGLSSVASETIPVTAAPILLMQPFPVVRITSTDTASGIRLKLLRVQAPTGAKIGVECKGHGCPARSESRIAAAGKVGAAPVEFRRFERSLRAGIVLEIRVSKAGEIGKFTSFYVRSRRLPTRVDACLAPSGVKPIACP